MYQKINEFVRNNMKYLIIAIQVGMVFLIFNAFSDISVTSFDNRIMGAALKNGVDITKRINNFYLLFIICIPALTFIAFKVLKKVLENESPKVIKFMNLIAVIGIINTVLIGAANSQSVPVDSSLVSKILLLINIITISVIILSKLYNKKFIFENLKWAYLAAFPIAFLLSLVMHQIGLKCEWTIFYVVGVIVSYIVINLKWINKEVLKKAYIAFICAPLLEAIYLETYNILNQHDIFLKNKMITIFIIYAVCILITAVYYLVNKKKRIKFNYTKFYYPIIILSFTMIIAGIPMVKYIYTDFFESANHGVSIYEFLKLGKIPLIETFDAHMLKNQVFGILYGILNNDATGAALSLYNSYGVVLIGIIMYFFLKKIFSRETAFYITMFFPISLDFVIQMYYMVFVGIFALINAYKKKTFKSYLLYWLVIAFLCIWQLDIGFSTGFATAIPFIYLIWKNRKETGVKKPIIALIIVICIFLIIFLGVCIIKDVNPITRGIEFLEIARSNINWSYADSGSTDTYIYRICYLVMPLAMVGSLIYLIYKSIKIDKKISTIDLMLIVIGFFYIFNAQRGIVRHSLAEGETYRIINLALIYFAILIMRMHKKDVRIFLTCYVLFIASWGATQGENLTPIIKENGTILEQGVSKYSTFEAQDEIYLEKVNRLQLADEMINEFKNLKIVVQELLENNETYLDFSNQTLLYALFDKEKPVYVNQSPGLLSGELSQQMFIDEVKRSNKNVNYVLTAKEKHVSYQIDGIPNNYRYYLVSEFIFKEYTPLLTVDGYTLWVKKDMYEDKVEKAKRIENENVKIEDTMSFLEDNIQNYEIDQIPRIWGEYDDKKEEVKEKGKVLSTNSEGKINIDVKDIDKSKRKLFEHGNRM